ncbi:MAG: hypothetical protein ACP5LZ_06095 [Fervidicoccaceae archaeon]|jgi:predicted glutamine amidotransferase
MCRMLALMGTILPHSANKYEKMIKGLVSSAYYDPYAARIFGQRGASHKHGWGRATVYLEGNGISYSINKHIHPIYVVKPGGVQYTSSDVEYFRPFVIDLIHARAASPDTEVSIFNVQPFEFVTSTGDRLILAHNGSVDKERLVLDSKDKIPKEVAERHSDTFMLGYMLSQEVGKSLDISLLRKYKDYVKSALNLIALLITEEKVDVMFGSYFTNDEHDYYYKLFLKNERNSIMVSSSTAVDFYYDEEDASSWIPINKGEFYIGKVKYRDGGARLVDLNKNLL